MASESSRHLYRRTSGKAGLLLRGYILTVRQWGTDIKTKWSTLTTLYVCVCVCVCELLMSLCDLMDCSPPGSSVHGILQARILGLVAISFSRASSLPRDQTQVFWIAGRFFTVWATREAHPLHICGQMPQALHFLGRETEIWRGEICLKSWLPKCVPENTGLARWLTYSTKRRSWGGVLCFKGVCEILV